MRLLISVVIYFTFFQNLDCLNGNPRSNARQNYFDIELLRYSTEDIRGNVVISPTSLKAILAMLLEGAKGLTAKETRNALRLSPDKEELREQMRLYLTALKANANGVLLENANAIFVSRKLSPKKDYVTMLQNIYMTEVGTLDFSKPVDAAEVINHWVDKKTRGFIPYIVEPAYFNPTTFIFMANAIFFKSSWHHAFDPKLTHGGCFYNQGVCQTVAMMEMDATLNYAFIENLMAHALELPYEGNRYSMILLVPAERDGCSSLIRDLPYMSLSQISEVMEPSDVTLSLPKFTINYSEDMVGSLRNMRINSLFTAASNLTGIFEGDKPYVSSIFHKVLMSVDEAGTVASAATSAMIVPLIYSGVVLTVNRPFVFFIRDNELDLILFEGKIEEPTAYIETDSLSVKEEQPLLSVPSVLTTPANVGNVPMANIVTHPSNEKLPISNVTPQPSNEKVPASNVAQFSNAMVPINNVTSQFSDVKVPSNNGTLHPSYGIEQTQSDIKTTTSVPQQNPVLGFFSKIFG